MDFDRINAAKRRMNDRAHFRAAGYLRTDARRSIKKRKKKSAVGSPPSTQTKRLRDAMRFHVFRGEGKSIIGPSAQVVGEAGAAHEHGELYMGDRYPQRPFMGPSLERTEPKLAGFFENTFY